MKDFLWKVWRGDEEKKYVAHFLLVKLTRRGLYYGGREDETNILDSNSVCDQKELSFADHLQTNLEG
jgi:hypothetical protein